ncbi:Salt tolerance 2, putative isoform 1 [Hibiscus syriacus]|uniref:Salt tolerance 2, putative isoform 1 n=1 Tax=Hibiscus syriacus TaxID=106335 RepID=A0A6A2YGA0_HIBSY|nr:Salt tolerance 2, putative isoform 1 [Hibiscus syriacus]
MASGLFGNLVTGEIPAVLGSLPHLQELYLDNNHLHGPIPSSFNNLTRLKRLEIQWDYVFVEFPDLGSLIKLYFLDASDNNVSGQVPSTLPVSLVELSMKNNIPDNINKIRFLQVLDLSHNMLYGAISSVFFKYR